MTKPKRQKNSPKQIKIPSIAAVQNKPSIQKAKSNFFSPDEQRWMIMPVAFSFKILMQSLALFSFAQPSVAFWDRT